MNQDKSRRSEMNGDEPDQHSRPRGKNISFKFLSFGTNLDTHNCIRGYHKGSTSAKKYINLEVALLGFINFA